MDNLFGEEPPPTTRKVKYRARSSEPSMHRGAGVVGHRWSTFPNAEISGGQPVAPPPLAPPMDTPRWFTGDVFDGLARLEDGSVDLVVTSPPFLALRSYLPADHPLKAREIGSEATPAAFIDVMLAVTAELRRVLAPHGSIAVELGDTYAGSGGGGGDYLENGWREGQAQFAGSAASMRESNAAHWRQKNTDTAAWPLAKCKAMIPELYRVALAYGINPLTGQESPAGKWRVRNTVTWCRPNPPVGALGDKWRPATSDIAVACVSAKRYWDDIATRTEPLAKPQRFLSETGYGRGDGRPYQDDSRPLEHEPTNRTAAGGAPLLDWWEITAGGYRGAHYATFPSALVVPLVKAMCPMRVCVQCGEPSRRIVEADYGGATWASGGQRNGLARQPERVDVPFAGVTSGWSDCGHGEWRPGVVLDPFAGSGTTLLVAHGHSRDSIGIDLDARNRDLTQQRLGPLIPLGDLDKERTP